jgi:hypothetical protein
MAGLLEDELCPDGTGNERKMRDDQHRFLALLGHLPARLTAEQTAWVLNCQLHDMPALVAAKLLKPLGNPPQNGVKFFATREVLELSKDDKWLHRATSAIHQHWHSRNARKMKQQADGPPQVEAEVR